MNDWDFAPLFMLIFGTGAVVGIALEELVKFTLQHVHVVIR